MRTLVSGVLAITGCMVMFVVGGVDPSLPAAIGSFLFVVAGAVQGR